MSKVLEGLLYSESHEWVKVEGDIAVIGVSDFAQKEMGNITYVDLPDVDDEVEAGEDFGALRCCQQVRIQPELDRQRPVQLDQPGGGHGGRRDAGKKVRRQRRIGVLERKMDGHIAKIGRQAE